MNIDTSSDAVVKCDSCGETTEYRTKNSMDPKEGMEFKQTRLGGCCGDMWIITEVL